MSEYHEGSAHNEDGSTKNSSEIGWSYDRAIDYKDQPPAFGFVAILRPGQETAEVVRYDVFVAALFKQMPPAFMKLHAALGVCGEAGELSDPIKSEVIYGKPANRANIVEELGDLRFYMQATMQLYGITEQEVLQENAIKLSKRYVNIAYSDEAAIARADNAKD